MIDNTHTSSNVTRPIVNQNNPVPVIIKSAVPKNVRDDQLDNDLDDLLHPERLKSTTQSKQNTGVSNKNEERKAAVADMNDLDDLLEDIGKTAPSQTKPQPAKNTEIKNNPP